MSLIHRLALALGVTLAVPAIAQVPVAPPAPPAAAPAPSLTDIPGVTVRYYDVTGVTIEAIRASIAAQRPADPSGQVSPSMASWSIATSLKKETTGDKCRIVSVMPTFKAEVVMPRLVGVEAVPVPVLAEWQRYVASLEQQQVAVLRRPYERLSEVRSAVMASTCEGAGDAADRAIAEITKAPPPPPPPPVPEVSAQ